MEGRRLYPIGIQTFSKLREGNYVYVDKTELVYRMTHGASGYIFLSRPRRFGKSLLTSTLHSYFEGRKELFEGLAIECLEKEWTSYPVLHFDMSTAKHMDKDRLLSELERKLYGYEQIYGRDESAIYTNQRLESLIQRAYAQTGQKVVVLIDEYDAPLTVCMNNPELFDFVRKKLSRLYASFKNYEGVIRFLFLTGISKFNKTSIFSELNTLTDISLSPRYGSLLGYTHEEVVEYFKNYLDRSAKALGIESDQLLDKLVSQYDGFCFEETVSKKVFAPWSLLSFFAEPERGFKNYWFESGGRPYALLEYLKSHGDTIA